MSVLIRFYSKNTQNIAPLFNKTPKDRFCQVQVSGIAVTSGWREMVLVTQAELVGLLISLLGSSSPMVALGALFSLFWILATSSWMRTPAGYAFTDGSFSPWDWFQTVFSPSFPYRLAHTVTSQVRRARCPGLSAPGRSSDHATEIASLKARILVCQHVVIHGGRARYSCLGQAHQDSR
jgi:hypothetical protein